MTVRDCILQIRQAAEQLMKIDLGYPPGRNEAIPAAPLSTVESTLNAIGLTHVFPVREFYSICDGLNLPDVNVGYFIKPISKLAGYSPDSEPTVIRGPYAGEVVSIGSTGGGGLFVMQRNSEIIVHLPPGPIHLGVYDGSDRKVVKIAQDFGEFLNLILGDLIAVGSCNWAHTFIV